MPRVIFNGESGEAFTNETEKVQFQFVASLTNTCGQCLQYHMAISSFWPIPLHRACACRQVPVAPGATAQPWVDFRKLLDGMDPAQQREAVGASNYKLLKAGVVKWEDVVTNARVRTFREVVSREKLSVADLTKHGVAERIARAAYESVHTPAHEIAAAHRRSLVASLETAGLTPSQVRDAFARGIASRIGLSSPHRGPSPVSPLGLATLIQTLGLDAAKVKAALKKAEDERKAKEAKKKAEEEGADDDQPTD